MSWLLCCTQLISAGANCIVADMPASFIHVRTVEEEMHLHFKSGEVVRMRKLESIWKEKRSAAAQATPAVKKRHGKRAHAVPGCDRLQYKALKLRKKVEHVILSLEQNPKEGHADAIATMLPKLRDAWLDLSVGPLSVELLQEICNMGRRAKSMVSQNTCSKPES